MTTTASLAWLRAVRGMIVSDMLLVVSFYSLLMLTSVTGRM